ncbi:hypothetical protein [Moraxella equi]|uniref:Uncharacterized protein n=1 Tax=Moraxella equi TaxID=60442 RepID=A0A378UR22_9GAMM|nr:hypothetical protein [Moraxella equi]OPH37667.1 hypothetical protein B5J93_08070 [Moraxella equi]STZ82929.1 Uncharacterised protein [Moraxella equi]
MARPRLTKEAIAFIVECRDNPKEIHTWEDIANLVSDKFGIKVSFQAIAKNYQKHKDSIQINRQSLEVNKNQNHQILETKKPLFKPKQKPQTLSQGFDKNDDDFDLEDLLSKAE